MALKVLHIEDNELDQVILKAAIQQLKPELIQVKSIEEAKKHNQIAFDIILADLGLQETEGLETLNAIEQIFPYPPIIVLTGHDDDILAKKAIEQGADDFLTKAHINARRLTTAINYAINRNQTNINKLEKVSKEQFNITINQIKALNELYAYQAKNEQDFLDFALQKAIEITSSGYGYIYKYDETTQLFELNTWSKDVMPNCNVQNPQTCYELDKTGFWGEAVRQRKAIVDNNFSSPNRLKKGIPEGHVQIKNFMTLPIFEGKRIIAVVGLANKKTNFSDEDQVLTNFLMKAVFSILEKIQSTEKAQKTFHAIEQAKTSVVITNVDGNIEYVNPYFLKVTGYSFNEVKGQNPRVLKSGHQPKEFYKNLWHTITKGRTWRGELRNKRKDGTFYWEEAVISPLKNADGKITHYIAVKNDITKQKAYHEELSSSQRLLSQSEKIEQSGGWEYDVEKQAIEWTPGLFRLHELDEDFKGDKIKTSLSCYSKEDNKRIAEAFQECIKTGKGYDFTVPFTTIKGKKLWVRTKTEALKENGKVVKVFGTVQDVTKFLKQNIELKEQKQLIDKAFEISNSGSFYFDIKTKTFTWHPSAAKVLNFKRVHCTWQAFAERFHPEDKQRVIFEFESAWNGSEFESEHRFLVGNFEWWIKAQAQPIYGNDNKPTAMVGFVQDITKRKNAEIKSKENETLLASIAANFPKSYVSVVYKDLTLGFSSGEEFTKRGLMPQHFFGVKVHDVFKGYGEDILNKVLYHYNETLKGKKQDFEIFVDNQFQKYATVPLFAENNKVDRFLVVTRNITEEKENAQKIAESEQFKSHVISSLTEGLIVSDDKGNVILSNDQAGKLLNLSPFQLEKIQSRDLLNEVKNINKEPVPYEKLPPFLAFESKKPILKEKVWVKPKNKPEILLTLNAVPLLDETGEINQIITTFHDITAEEQLKESLNASKKQYESLFHQNNVGIAETSLDGKFSNYNEALLKIFELTAEEFEQKNIVTLTHPEFLPQEEKLINEIMQGKRNSYRIEKKILNPNGTKWIDLSVKGVYNDKGELKSLVGAAADIDERKKAEQALIANQQLLEMAQKVAQLGSWQYNAATDEVNWSDELFSIFEIPKELGAPSFATQKNLYTKESFELLNNVVEQTLKTGKPYEVELEIITHKGKHKHIISKGELETDKEGDTIGLYGIAQDVTDKKLATLELKASTKKLEEAQEIAHIGNWEYIFESGKITWSDELFRIFDLPIAKEAPSYQEQEKIYTKESFTELDKAIAKLTSKGETYELESEIITTAGNRKIIFAKGAPKKDKDNNIIGAVGIAQDITERKNLENEILNSKEQLQYAIEGTKAGTWDWNPETGETLFNERWAEIVGYTLRELAPISIETWNKLVHPDDLKTSYQALQDHFDGKSDMYDCRVRMKHKKGHWVWVWDRGKVVAYNKQGKPIRAVGTHVDISQLVKAEQDLLRSKERMGKVIMNSPAPQMLHKKGKVLLINNQWQKLTGYTLEDIPDIATWTQKAYGEKSKPSKEFIANLYKLKAPQADGIWEVKTKSGKLLKWDFFSSPVDEDTVLSVAIDVTEKEKTTQKLIESEKNYRFLTEELNEIIWSAKSDGVLDFINNFGIEYFGENGKKILEKGWLSVLHPDDIESASETYLNFLNRKTPIYENQFRVLNQNNEYRYLFVSATPQLDKQGNITKIIGYAVDKQDEVNAQIERETKRKELDFLAKYGKLWIEAKTPKEVFELVAQGVYELLETKTITTAAIYLNEGTNWQSIKTLGIESWEKFIPKRFGFEDMSGPTLPKLIENANQKDQIIDLGSNVHELSSGSVPKFVSDIAAKVLPKFRVLAVNLFKGDEVFGNISFLEFEHTPKINQEVLFTFLNEASTTLEKLFNKQELEDSNLRFQLASASTNDVVWDWDVATGDFVWGNSVYTVFGDLDLKGHISDWWKNIHKDDLDRIEKEVNAILENASLSNYEFEYRFRRADNTYAEVKETGTILRDKKGKAYRVVGAIRDQTEIKTYLKKIETQNKRFKTISWIQSHELRAPLSRILGIAELIKTRDLEEGLLDELIENLIKSSSELDSVIKSIIDETS